MLKDHGIDLCCVTETWLKSDDRAKFAEIHDLGFDIISAPRRGRGGGVAVIFNPKYVTVVKNNVKCSSFEAMECVLETSSGLFRFCIIYRTTQKASDETRVSKFMVEFENYLDTVLKKNGTPILCGDFNLHVENESDKVAKAFIDLCHGKGFHQHVDKQTHISGGTLDLVLTLNDAPDAVVLSNLFIESDTGTTSDHYLVSFELSVQPISATEQKFEYKHVREFDKVDIQEFREDIFTSPINMTSYQSMDTAVELYQKVLEDILQKHAPLVEKKFNKMKSLFWNEECQKAVRERRRAKRRYKKYPENQGFKNDFYERSVDAEIIINKTRDEFYKKKLSLAKGDSRATYKVINHLMDKEYGSSKMPNGTDQEVADNLKEFFDSKVKTIYSQIELEAKNITSPTVIDNATRHHDKTPLLSCFKEISEEELSSIINGLPDKSSSLDVIPLSLFKKCLPELFPIIHFIVNESLKNGEFPTALKEAAIRPSLKKPSLDSDNLKNYRPISNLTYLSKILEKVVHGQLTEFTTSNNLITKAQSGYRQFHSCETAVTKIYNDILLMIDKKENVVLLLLDLSAAFDTINHKLLLKKLKQSYGITGAPLKWMESYLANRSFKVIVKECSSSSCMLEIGVPQGSILGPLLFIMYTCDLEHIVSKYGYSIHLYADDTQVYFAFDVHSPNPDLSRVKACFAEIKQWMTLNFLKLNDDKTEFIDIGPYISPISSLNFNELSIVPVKKAKNLGFIFDHQLNLSDQICTISQKCHLNQRNLYRIASKLSHELKVQLVHSNILCFIDYCNSVYYTLTTKQLHSLQKIQNTAVRFVFNLYGKKSREHIMPYLKILHFLPVVFRIKFKIALLIFKCINNLAPAYLAELIQLRNIRRRSSRLDDDFFLLKEPQALHFQRTESAFSFCGPKIWNKLPYHIRSLSDIGLFKKHLKTFYFNIAFEGID